ncbi:MAG: restriction endonuclease subunit S, partial [Clostridiales bacterium]|nr:restriction endonuclease subunit S [Clostridiales bacterium]
EELETAIKQAKNKILDLAIHGKLVPQDPNDEPAEELLKRIATSDNRPYKKFDDEVLFEIPNSWAWSSMKNIVTINPKNEIDDDTQVSFIPMTLIDSEYKNTHGQEERLWKDIKKGFTHFAENDVAIAKISPCFENRKSVILRNLKNGYGAGTTELYILRPSKVVIPEYILWLVKSDNFINTGVGNFSGVVGQQRLARDIVEDFSVPLPPLAEQRRIVTKIENLFNQLDSIQNELIS